MTIQAKSLKIAVDEVLAAPEGIWLAVLEQNFPGANSQPWLRRRAEFQAKQAENKPAKKRTTRRTRTATRRTPANVSAFMSQQDAIGGAMTELVIRHNLREAVPQ